MEEKDTENKSSYWNILFSKYPLIGAFTFIVFTVITAGGLTIGKDYYQLYLEQRAQEKKAQQELLVEESKLALQRKYDSLKEADALRRRAEEARRINDAFIFTVNAANQLARDVKSMRVLVVKVPTVADTPRTLGYIPRVTVFAEGLTDGATPSIRSSWQNQVVPQEFMQNFDLISPKQGESTDFSYNRYSYVPDVAQDSILGRPASLSVFKANKTKSILTQYICRTMQGELFFISCSYPYINPIESHPELEILARTQQVAREIAQQLTPPTFP